jgi:hypothetical protein
MPDFDTPLYLDVSEDLRRVDNAMTRLLADRDLWAEFLRNPNGMLIRLGMHPETSRSVSDRVNRIFWLTITDRDLIRMIANRYRDFTPRRRRQLERYFVDGLMEGVIRHDIDYDLQAIKHFLDDEELVRRTLTRTLTLLNEAEALEQIHSREEISEYVDAYVQSLREGAPVSEHPRLEVWDEFYGIGQPFGGIALEVGPGITAAVPVEAVAYVTALLEVGFWGATAERFASRAIQGDEEAIRAIATVGRLLDFGAQLLVHAHAFQRRRTP